MSRLIAGERAGVFSALADPSRFEAVGLDRGSVTWRNALEGWPHDLDLAPDAMHDEIVEHGEWNIDRALSAIPACRGRHSTPP